MYADVSPERPASMSPIAQRTQPTTDPQAEGAEGGYLIQNLEGMPGGFQTTPGWQMSRWRIRDIWWECLVASTDS